MKYKLMIEVDCKNDKTSFPEVLDGMSVKHMWAGIPPTSSVMACVAGYLAAVIENAQKPEIRNEVILMDVIKGVKNCIRMQSIAERN